MVMAALQRAGDVGDVAPHRRHAQRQNAVVVGDPDELLVLGLEDGMESEIDDRHVAEPDDAADGRRHKPDLDGARQGDVGNRASPSYDDVARLGYAAQIPDDAP